MPHSNYLRLPQSWVAYLIAHDSMTSNWDIRAQAWLHIPVAPFLCLKLALALPRRLSQASSHGVWTLKAPRESEGAPASVKCVSVSLVVSPHGSKGTTRVQTQGGTVDHWDGGLFLKTLPVLCREGLQCMALIRTGSSLSHSRKLL